MEHEHLNNHRENIEKYFRQEDGIYDDIYGKGFSDYAASLLYLPDAFELKSRCICCIDEGTPEGMHAAGSGILMSEEELDKYFEKTKPEEITSHSGCGAAKLFAERHPELNITDPDSYAEQWAQQQADKRGLRYRHLSAEEMKRPEEGACCPHLLH